MSYKLIKKTSGSLTKKRKLLMAVGVCIICGSPFAAWYSYLFTFSACRPNPEAFVDFSCVIYGSIAGFAVLFLMALLGLIIYMKSIKTTV